MRVKEILDKIEIVKEPKEIEFPFGIAKLDETVEIIRGTLTIVAARPSNGKCLARGTKVIMYDGSIKSVENIVIGDALMGSNSRPRKVTTLGHGFEQMYRIQQVRGDGFVCNRSHILSLMSSGTVKNISIGDYLKQSKKFKHHYKLYKSCCVKFKPKKLSPYLSPYFLGLWLGDGDSTTQTITNTDKEIIKYLGFYARKLKMKNTIYVDKRNGCKRITINLGWGHKTNPIREELRKYNLMNNKHIPVDFLINSVIYRRFLLAGLLDSDGWKNGKCCAVFSNTNKKLCKDVVFLCRSLGLSATLKSKISRIKRINYSCVSYNVYIGGDLTKIPIKVERKKMLEKPKKRNVLVSGFSIKSIGVGEYFGFTLDGDGLFLLKDFTVTHNTLFAFNNIAVSSAEKGKYIQYYSLEDSKDLYMRRYIASQVGVNSKDIRRGTITDDEFERISIFLQEHSDLPIDLFNDIGYTPSQIIDNLKKHDKPDMIVVDYVNKASLGGLDEYRAITEYSHQMPLIARNLDCAMVLCCQVGRAAQGEGNSQTIHPPQLHHLRNTGALEQDAQSVIFLHYKYKYTDKPEDRNNIQIIVAKNKDGETGCVDCNIIPEYNRIVDRRV